MRFLLLTISICFLISCKDTAGPSPALLAEIKGLTTVESQREFLESIYNKYLELRKKETAVWNDFGRYSQAYKNMVNDHKSQDDIYLTKIETYLNIHGHPNIMKHGRIGAYIPIIQIQQSDNEDVLRANYKYINEAYLFKDISAELFYKYLIQLYRYEKLEKYLPSPDYGIEENIEVIREALDFTK